MKHALSVLSLGEKSLGMYSVATSVLVINKVTPKPIETPK